MGSLKWARTFVNSGEDATRFLIFQGGETQLERWKDGRIVLEIIPIINWLNCFFVFSLWNFSRTIAFRVAYSYLYPSTRTVRGANNNKKSG